MPGTPDPSKRATRGPEKPGEPQRRPFLSSFPWWYLLMILSILWIWQEYIMAYGTVKTIPYSQFKAYLAGGEVAKAEIHENDIVGQIVPKASSEQKKDEKAVPADNGKPPAPAAVPKQPVDSGGKAAEAKPLGQPSAPNEKKPAAAEDSNKTSGEAKGEEAPGSAETDPTKPFAFRTITATPAADPELIKQLEAAHVPYSFARSSFLAQFVLAWLLPLGAIFVLWYFLTRGLRNAGQAVMGFGRSKARVVADKDTGVTFDDVAGCDEAKYELQEVVDFLQNPDRYTALGAKIPKGVLLVGPPGTGKTLLSRAVAGEAGVPFFSLSGSEFVEMFVGVGAARVRDLFEQAKAQSPCIIFIDELDAIGRERGVHLGPVNDEREQTLNQLLVEMDGFEANVGVIILAATNRPEVLDRALLRPGRFDRQVVIDAPDLEGRLAILKVHARNKPLAPDVDLRRIAQGTPGFSGADLANALNEAALIAARRKAATISQHDLEEAVEKVLAGPERKTRRLVEEEKRRVAYHEAGHALVATFSQHADQVHKISIVPRGRAALGYTLQLPEGDQFLMTQSDLLDRIKGLLGGRAAEEIVFHEVSTGAENDLERATTLARQMVAAYGMSDTVGLLHCGNRMPGNGIPFLPAGDRRPDCSEETADQIDREVKRMLENAYEEAKGILRGHREQLSRVADALIQRETLNKREFLDLVGISADGEIPEEGNGRVDLGPTPVAQVPHLSPGPPENPRSST